MEISKDEHYLLLADDIKIADTERKALAKLKGILKETGKITFTIDDELLKNIKYDCLNDAEQMMFLFIGKKVPDVEKPVFSYIYQTEDVVIGDYYEKGEKGYIKGDDNAKNRDNIRSILGFNIPTNDDVEPEIGNSFFICRMYRTSKGNFPYHAAFVLYEDGNHFFTLETWTEYVEKDDKEVAEKHWGFDVYGKINSDTETFHEKRKSDYIKKQESKMKEDEYPITIQIALRKKYQGE